MFFYNYNRFQLGVMYKKSRTSAPESGQNKEDEMK